MLPDVVGKTLAQADGLEVAGGLEREIKVSQENSHNPLYQYLVVIVESDKGGSVCFPRVLWALIQCNHIGIA